MIVILAKK